MGGGGSKTIVIPKPPPIRQEQPYPLVDPIGIGKGMAQGCDWGGRACELAVAKGVSASGAKLYRDQGSVRRDVCKRYSEDLKRVTDNQKAFEEVKKDLLAGAYYEDLNNGYCRQIAYDKADLDAARTPDQLTPDKARYPTIRKMSDSGSFSAVTKLFIRPSIPFEVEFNGRPHKFSVLTVMHPSPIRVENVQHDAMITLGDPEANDGLVILVPLMPSFSPGPSGDFVGKIARYMTGVLLPDPATGQYESIDIPTGNDWDVSKLFPGTPAPDGKTYVTETGYYVWSGHPPLTLQPGPIIQYGEQKKFGNWLVSNPDTQLYEWRASSASNTRYLMLSKPAFVSSFDLQTIRMLPATPASEAFSPMLKHTLVYRTPGRMGADGKWISSCSKPPAGLSSIGNFFTSGRESMTDFESLTASLRESGSNLKGLKIDKCDPFSPDNFPKRAPNKDEMISGLIWFIGAFGVLLAVYFAIRLFSNREWGLKIADWATQFGTSISQLGVKKANRIPPPDTFVVKGGDEKEDELMRMGKAAEELRLGAKGMWKEENPLRTRKKAKEEDEELARMAKGAQERLRVIAQPETENPLLTKKKATETPPIASQSPAGTGLLSDEELARNTEVEKARVEAEEEAKKEAAAIEEARIEAEVAAKKKADEEAAAIEEARIEAEVAAKKKADEEAAAIEEARIKAEAEANAKYTKMAKDAFKAAEEKKKAEAEEAEKKKADEEKAAAEEAEKKKADEEKAAAEEAEKKKADEEEARIKAAAEEAAKSASQSALRQKAKLRKVLPSDPDLLKRAEEERKKEEEAYKAKQEEQSRMNAPGTSGRTTATVPSSVGVSPPVPVESIKDKLVEHIGRLKKREIDIIKLQKANANILTLRDRELKLQKDIDALDRLVKTAEEAAKDMTGLERLSFQKTITEAKTVARDQRKRSQDSLAKLKTMNFKGYAMQGGKRRKNRGATRRHVA
jgi:hypothetical protein